jgi:Family of unknown function (DUF6922)
VSRPLPGGARRLFPDYDPAALADPAHAPFVIARLLEDGDGTDLRWLAERYGEARLAGWLAAAGGRALSRRSRAFWRLLLATPAAPPLAAAAALWPL